MKIISELTTEELHERILHATRELMEREVAKKYEGDMDAIARVTASVDEPETKLNTVKRKPKVGERILIVDGEKTGEIYTVVETEVSDCFWGVDVKEIELDEDEWAFVKDEYEVIIEDETIEHEGLLLKKVNRNVSAGVYVRFNDMNATAMLENGVIYGPVKRSMTVGANDYNVFNEHHNRTPDNVEVFEVVEATRPLTPNQQRAELNQRAREFVDGYKDNIILFGTYVCDAVFKVNRKKRTVTCMLVGQGTGYVRKRATTKCHPNEVFNEDIGKAISLCLVRQIDIPQEFIDAVQPDEVVAGMKVIYDDEKSRGLLTVISNNHGGIYPPHETKLLVAETPPTTIIDDTNAEYGEV